MHRRAPGDSSTDLDRSPGTGGFADRVRHRLLPRGAESPSAEAVAYAEAGDGEVGTHVGPATDGSYVVRAACVGADRISYELVVDDTPRIVCDLDCGAEVINTAFSGGAESVMIRFPTRQRRRKLSRR